jgi:hypothetical protein
MAERKAIRMCHITAYIQLTIYIHTYIHYAITGNAFGSATDSKRYVSQVRIDARHYAKHIIVSQTMTT